MTGNDSSAGDSVRVAIVHCAVTANTVVGDTQA